MGAMKKVSMTLLALMTFAFLGSSEVIIYKQNITWTTVGNGSVSSKLMTGWFVIGSITNGPIAQVDLFKGKGQFTVQYPETWQIANPSKGPNGSCMVIAVQTLGIGSVTAKGVNSTNEIGLIDTMRLAKVLTVTGSDLIATNQIPTFDFYSGTLTYDHADTFNANFQSWSFNEVIGMLRTNLLSKGYVEQ